MQPAVGLLSPRRRHTSSHRAAAETALAPQQLLGHARGPGRGTTAALQVPPLRLDPSERAQATGTCQVALMVVEAAACWPGVDWLPCSFGRPPSSLPATGFALDPGRRCGAPQTGKQAPAPFELQNREVKSPIPARFTRAQRGLLTSAQLTGRPAEKRDVHRPARHPVGEL